MLLHAELPHQEAQGEVDAGAEHPLLLLLHRGPVLPRVLHPHTHRLRPGPGRRPPLVSQVHLPHSGMSLVAELFVEGLDLFDQDIFI